MVNNIKIFASDELIDTIDFALIAIREDEFEAVLKFFPPTAVAKGKQRTYEIADFLTNDGTLYRAAIVRSIEQGHLAAQATASDVISDLNPSWIVVIGIAGGLPENEFSLGDVVLANRMIDFSISAALANNKTEIAHRGAPAHKAVQNLISRLGAIKSILGNWNHPQTLGLELPQVLIDDDHLPSTEDDWKKKLRSTLENRFQLLENDKPRLPIVTAAPIASGNMLMKDPQLVQQWLENARDLKAVEMELPGIYEAAHRLEGDIPVLAVRGISDIIGFKRNPAWTSFSCYTAASLARALINSRPIEPLPKTQKKNNELKSLSIEKIILEGSEVSEHHGEDVSAALNAILKRRVIPSNKPLEGLHELSKSFELNGRYAATPPAIKAKVFDWIARLSAANNNLKDAEIAQKTLLEMGIPPSPITLAWIDVARDKVDDALTSLRLIESNESRSAIFGILRNKKSIDDALRYFDLEESHTPEKFTAVGWVNIISTLLDKDRINEAASLLSSFSRELIAECPYLGYLRGLVYLANSVSEDYRDRVLSGEHLSTIGHMLEGDDADDLRKQSYESFNLCSEEAKINDDLIFERSEHYKLWLRLIDPIQRETELSKLSEKMNDGKTAVEFMPLAHALNLDFDTTPITKFLQRSTILGGLSPNELNANFLLLIHLKQFNELATFIKENWAKLLESSDPIQLHSSLIQAYIHAGECGQADIELKARINDLNPFDIPRFELMIKNCKGEDPTSQAKETYEKSGEFIDLTNLVNGLESLNRWVDLTPYALELFKREPNVANALRQIKCMQRGNLSNNEIISFLDSCSHISLKEPELISVRAWALFHIGEVLESHALNSYLLNIRNNPNDIALNINLALRMGDWEKLPTILDRVWTTRNELPVGLLLYLAKLNSSSSKDRVLQLVKECAIRDPENPNTLLQAYSVASAMGHDEIAMPLMNKAAELSKDDSGPIKSISFKEVVEMVKASAESWRKKNDLFREGKIPLQWAAGIFNIPISRLLIAIPRENKDQFDPQKRQPIPIISGNRKPAKTSDIKKLALDITSILVLNELNYLELIIENLEELYISPRLMETLLYDIDKVKFHQPSRIAAAKPLLELYRKGQIISVDTKGPEELVKEVGKETASLLSSAKDSSGLYIQSGKLYQIDSYMDKEAHLGEFNECIASTAIIINALHNEGRITQSIKDEALAYLDKVNAGEMSGPALAPTAPVYLDRNSAQYLSDLKLLNELTKSNRLVYVHKATVEEWEALIDTEPYSENIITALEEIRKILRDGVIKSKVKFLRENNTDDNNFSKQTLLINDFFEDISKVDAVCIDDRLINSQLSFEDNNSIKVPLFCILDVIKMLVERGAISDINLSESMHKMREWCFSAIPLDDKEIFDLLSTSKIDDSNNLIEPAQLRVLREYLSRLHSSDFLCTSSDMEYMDKLWQVGLKLIRDLWEDKGAAISEVTVKSDWVFNHVHPDIKIALRFATNDKQRIEEIAIARMRSFATPIKAEANLYSAYIKWVEKKLIASYVPVCPKLSSLAYDKIRKEKLSSFKHLY
jgi:nucleoside phosphorylase